MHALGLFRWFLPQQMQPVHLSGESALHFPVGIGKFPFRPGEQSLEPFPCFRWQMIGALRIGMGNREFSKAGIVARQVGQQAGAAGSDDQVHFNIPSQPPLSLSRSSRFFRS